MIQGRQGLFFSVYVVSSKSTYKRFCCRFLLIAFLVCPPIFLSFLPSNTYQYPHLPEPWAAPVPLAVLAVVPQFRLKACVGGGWCLGVICFSRSLACALKTWAAPVPLADLASCAAIPPLVISWGFYGNRGAEICGYNQTLAVVLWKMLILRTFLVFWIIADNGFCSTL